MEKYITGKLSIVDVVSYLEPFLIYTDNLTYMQYVEIIHFIDREISNYNKKFIEKGNVMRNVNKLKSETFIFTTSYPILAALENKINIFNEVFEEYNINTIEIKKTRPFTNSEILRKMMIIDSTKLYVSAIALQNASLMFPSQFLQLFDQEKNLEPTDQTCKQIIISKRYNNLAELEKDNDKTIYYDKRYDKTNYGLLDRYENDIVKMTPENFIIHLINELKKTLKLNDIDAEYLANTLIDGYKKVLDGDYAILNISQNQIGQNQIGEIAQYYKRVGNKWVLDTDIEKELNSKQLNTDDINLLCNFQKNCISTPDSTCETIPSDRLTVQNNLLSHIMGEFDEKYTLTNAELKESINQTFEYSLSLLSSLSKIQQINMLKYDNEKYVLGITEENGVSIISPYVPLLNLILSQGDFVKKQTDIVRFVTTYTRSPTLGVGPLGEQENSYWLYCVKTNVPLLPMFKYNMATAYINDPSNYNNYVDLLISQIGQLSDDGHLWTDEHSGWTIKKIEENYEEGYEDGFKITSRAILEDDAGNKITSASGESKLKYTTPLSKLIYNIIQALSIAMGINIEIQNEFIINGVMQAITETLESEDDYKIRIKEMAEKGKKITTYKDFYNNAVLYFTLGMFLIALQTAIPSIKTRKTHPGCIKSFTGFPYEGNGDNSSLNYLACVTYDIRHSSEPWNVLKGKKPDFISAKIKTVIESVLLTNINVKQKMVEKTEYLLMNPNEEIPQEHNVTNWLLFLPPLVPFKIQNLSNVSEDFQRALMNDLKTGSPAQKDKILVIESKIIQFSLSIQEKIQEIVKTQNLLLNKNNNEPFLENSCCETKDHESTISYFINKNKNILQYNQNVEKLSYLLDDITSFTKSSLFYSNINTKNIYPSIRNHLDEKTVYLTFIYYCKFKSLMPIPENLLPLCIVKPEISMNQSIDEIIQKFKSDGKDINYESCLRLLQLVARENIINIHFDVSPVSPITKLSGILETIEDENDDFIEGSLRNLMNNMIDTYDIAVSTISQSSKDMNNFLIKQIEIMKIDVLEFINKNKGKNVTQNSFNKTTKTINNLSTWLSDTSTHNTENIISDDKMYTIVQFFKTFIFYLSSVFPNIILNKVEYKITIPNYLGLSPNHSKKIKDLVNDYYKKLYPFYGVTEIFNILNKIQILCKNVVKLTEIIPSYTTIKHKTTEIHPIFNERTSKFLFEYFLLKIFIAFIDLTDDDDMIVTEIKKEYDETDLFTEEFLEETYLTTPVLNTQLTSGNKKDLKHNISYLLVTFISILEDQKQVIDVSYESITEKVVRLKEREKDIVTDRLKFLTDEERDADTILKINKLGVWSKGLQKGLRQYVKETYDEERELREEMDKIEKKVRNSNKDATNENVDIYMEDYIAEKDMDLQIDKEEYNMDKYTDDYGDGNYDGDEVDNSEEYDS
jgi:hypothetical protein